MSPHGSDYGIDFDVSWDSDVEMAEIGLRGTTCLVFESSADFDDFANWLAQQVEKAKQEFLAAKPQPLDLKKEEWEDLKGVDWDKVLYHGLPEGHICLNERNFEGEAKVGATVKYSMGMGANEERGLIVYFDYHWGWIINRNAGLGFLYMGMPKKEKSDV